MQPSTHIVFGEAGVVELRDALRELGCEDRVLHYPDDLSFGPIAQTNPLLRAKWISDELSSDGWQEIAEPVAVFWDEVLSGSERHVVWFSRRVTRDYVGFLHYLSRIGNRSCDVADLTEILVPVRSGQGAIRGSRRAISIGLLESYQFLDGNLFACAVPLADEVRAVYRAEWERLHAENAPLRVITQDLCLASVPLNYFDDMLLQRVQPRFLKAARIIGQVLADKWDADIIEVGDFFLSRRLLTLARAGVIESKGDLTRIGFSEVRLPPVI